MRAMSPLLNDFLNIYQTLSKFQRKVFKYLQWFSRKWRNVFPCIFTMVKALGCSESTVKRATAYFQKMGWVCKVKRGYQSNFYYMNDELIDVNLDDQSIFLRKKRPVNDPINDPVLRVPKLKSDISTSKGVQVCKTSLKQAPQKRDVPYFLNMKGLSPNDQQRLANEFSDQALIYAKEGALKYVGWGNKIRNLIAVMWKLAKKC